VPILICLDDFLAGRTHGSFVSDDTCAGPCSRWSMAPDDASHNHGLVAGCSAHALGCSRRGLVRGGVHRPRWLLHALPSSKGRAVIMMLTMQVTTSVSSNVLSIVRICIFYRQCTAYKKMGFFFKYRGYSVQCACVEFQRWTSVFNDK
jgi:hypothetical protein